ncbi:tRNA-splicing endonuclease subunit Sen15 isoform 4-T4 [Vipera latastei]
MEKSKSDCGDGSKEGGSVAGCSVFFGREEETPKPGKWALREDWLATHPTVSRRRTGGTKISLLIPGCSKVVVSLNSWEMHHSFFVKPGAAVRQLQFTKMMSLEVADSRGVYAAFLVYLDLLEVRNWHEVSFTGLAEFQLVCLHGREKETEPLQVVVPTPAQVSFSHESLSERSLCSHAG